MDTIVPGSDAEHVLAAAVAAGRYPRLRHVAELPHPKGVPVLGNAPQIVSLRFHATLEDWARELGPLYRFDVMQRTAIVVSSPETIAELLRERPAMLRRASHTANIIEETVIPGLFTAEGEEWRKQRKLVMRALTPEVVQRFFPTLSAMTERLHLRWRQAFEEARPVDVLRDLKAYTLDVTIALAMGQDLNTLEHEDNPLQRDIEFLFGRIARRITSPIAYWRLVKLAADREAAAAQARIVHAIAGFIAAARARMDANPALRAKPDNMLEAMVAARDEPDSGFTDGAVIGNAITMVFAGEDTTSNSIAWLIELLTRHPNVAAELAAETRDALAGAPVVRDVRLLERLPYLDAAIRESMRLKPVAPLLALEPLVDIALDDVLLPAGSMIFLLTRQAAERAGELVQPERFQPARWMAPGHAAAGSAADPARKSFPFGGGPRYCPGRYLALAEIKMAMTMLLRNFRLERVAGAPPVEELFTFTMTPSALPVLLHPRAN
ncbi:MAG: cytochrome P450 [Pseudomonadota bacterium]